MSHQQRVHEKSVETYVEIHYLEGLYKETFLPRNRGKKGYGHPWTSYDNRRSDRSPGAKKRTKAVKAANNFKQELLGRYGD